MKVSIMYKGALFDLDGTLADTFSDISNSANTLLARYGYPTRSREELLAAISFGRREFIQRILPSDVDDAVVQQALDSYTEYYSVHFMDTTRPYDGLIELITKLREKGFRTAVVTNKAHPNAVQMIEHIFPQGLFDGVWGLSSLPPKPDPSIALSAANAIGVNPAECFMIGDSELDVLTAKNAGMTPVGVSWGYRPVEVLKETGAEHIAHNAAELEAILFANHDSE